MPGHTSRENRESLWSPLTDGVRGRTGKSKDARRWCTTTGSRAGWYLRSLRTRPICASMPAQRENTNAPGGPLHGHEGQRKTSEEPDQGHAALPQDRRRGNAPSR